MEPQPIWWGIPDGREEATETSPEGPMPDEVGSSDGTRPKRSDDRGHLVGHDVDQRSFRHRRIGGPSWAIHASGDVAIISRGKVPNWTPHGGPP